MHFTWKCFISKHYLNAQLPADKLTEFYTKFCHMLLCFVAFLNSWTSQILIRFTYHLITTCDNYLMYCIHFLEGVGAWWREALLIMKSTLRIRMLFNFFIASAYLRSKIIKCLQCSKLVHIKLTFRAFSHVTRLACCGTGSIWNKVCRVHNQLSTFHNQLFIVSAYLQSKKQSLQCANLVFYNLPSGHSVM